MKLAKTLAKKYFAQGVMLLVITIVSTLISLLVIDLGRRIINVVTTQQSVSGDTYQVLFMLCLFMLITIFAGGAVSYLITIMSTRLTQAALKDIRMKLFSHIIRLPQDFYNKNPVGLILAMVTDDVACIGQFFSKVFLLPVMNIVMIIFYTVYIFCLNWKLAIAAVITLPTIVFILPRLNRKLAGLSQQYIETVGKMANYLLETFSGISDVRANQTYRFEEARFEDRNNESLNINLNLAKTAGVLKFFMKLIRWLGPLLVYFYGGLLCLKGEILVGSLVASIGVINSLYEPLDSFVSFLQEWQEVKVRFNKLDDYLSLTQESEILPGDKKGRVPTGDIFFEDVKFGFNDREILLKDIKLKTENGKKVGFVGTSGSGKSLTSALISRIYKPLSGHIRIGEDDINSVPLYDLRSKIGQVNQTPFLFNDTIKKNILYALLRKKGSDGSRLEEWIDFSLLDDIDSLEKLDKEIFKIIKQVGLWDDIYELGLRSKLQGDFFTDDNKMMVLQARKLFSKDNLSQDQQYIEHYDENIFMEYCSILENITFCPLPAITQEFGSTREFSRMYINEQLKASGLLDKLFDIGIKLAREDNFLLESLYKKNSALLGHLGLSRAQVEKRVQINQEASIGQEGNVDIRDLEQSVAEDVLDLAYNYTPGKSKADLPDLNLKKDLLQARRLFLNNLWPAVKEKLKFFDHEKYMDSMSLRENICFGSVNLLRTKANFLVNDLIKKVSMDTGLDELILKLGLEFEVGERGNRLSGGQRQKVSISRIILRNPSILIMDEATASLDASSQARITELIRQKFSGKTVISIAHRLGIVKDYDRIIVFDRGEIVQQGTFNELVSKEGLFKKLYNESN